MARRLGRRKEPLKEDFQLKEEKQIGDVLNERTMVYLSKFYNLGIIDKLGYVIARGKEADVFIATPGKSARVKGMKHVIVKFFRIETSSFNQMENYLIGDPRFSKKALRKSKFGVIMEWTKKEYGNLEIAAKAKVLAPKPVMFNGNILAMSFIGEDETPAPRLKEIVLENPEEVLDKILDDVKSLYKKRLVHADLSEYNILILNGEPYLIDFGQAVVIQHPNAIDFLQRDIKNLLAYFSKKYGVERDYGKTMNWIVG